MELTDAQREELFPQVFEEWLATGRRGRPRKPSTVRAYRAAWADFTRHCGAWPWRVRSGDVRRWVADMHRRELTPHVAAGLQRNGRRENGHGLSASSIAQRLAAISSFYEFGAHYLVELPGGKEEPYLDGPNPIRATTVQKPEVVYHKTGEFTVEEIRRLLLTIQADQSLRGLRDYALFLTYVATASRNQEIRCLRWGDISVHDGIAFFAWDNKGKAGEKELPTDAWDAITAYLSAAKDGALAPDDYIFTPLTDNVLRFGRIDPADWDRDRPLSAAEVNRLLRQYCKRAGIEARGVHCHMLRHTGAMLQVEHGGATVLDVMNLLGHSDLKVSTRYLGHRRGIRNEHWDRVADILALKRANVR